MRAGKDTFYMHNALNTEVRAALNECREIITKGSKSFSLAAKLFDPQTRAAAIFLYGWCRYCDDQVDEAGKSGDRDGLERRIRHVGIFRQLRASAWVLRSQSILDCGGGGNRQRDCGMAAGRRLAYQRLPQWNFGDERSEK